MGEVAIRSREAARGSGPGNAAPEILMLPKWTWSEATARFPGCCPWAIGTQKDNFLSFAVRIAAAVPGALVYENSEDVVGQQTWQGIGEDR